MPVIRFVREGRDVECYPGEPEGGSPSRGH